MILLWLSLGAGYVVVGQIICGAVMQDWDPAERFDRRVGIFFGLLLAAAGRDRGRPGHRFHRRRSGSERP